MNEPSHSRRDLFAGCAALLTAPRASFAQSLDALTTQEKSPVPLRDAYDLGERVTYLNHASIGTVPRAVREAHAAYELACERNPWLFVWGGAWDEAVTRVHGVAAAYIGCEPDDLAITRSTTEGFSLLASGLPLGKGDEVVFSSLNHVGASAAWEHWGERRGYSVRRFEFPLADVPGLSEADIVRLHVEALSDETRVLVLPHIDNLVGLRHPVRRIAQAARARGVRWVCVDGAQTVGMIPVQLAGLDVDAYATSAHKWLQAPKGTGLLYVARATREHLRPMIVTWGKKRWAGTARAYTDYGTRDLPKLLALEDAITFQQRVASASSLMQGVNHALLFKRARARVEAHAHLAWRSPPTLQRGAALYSIGLESGAAPELAQSLFTDAGFVVRPFESAGLNALRVSPNTSNTLPDLDRFFDALESRLA